MRRQTGKWAARGGLEKAERPVGRAQERKGGRERGLSHKKAHRPIENVLMTVVKWVDVSADRYRRRY